MKFSNAMLFGLALIVGVAIGYMFNPSAGTPPPAAGRPAPAKGAIRDDGGSASLQALQARIAELEAQLAKGAAGAKPQDGAAAKSEGERRHAEHRRMSPREWREKMMKENPRQYAEITNNIARMRRERLARAQKKVDFLSSLDVSGMSASAKKVHGELQDLIARREELEQRMQELHDSDEGPSDEALRQNFEAMHEIDRQIRELNAQERDNLMVETAKSLGFGDEEAGDVAEAFQEIIENTEGGFNTTGRPPHGGQGGPGGGPGGPGGPGGAQGGSGRQ